MKFLYVLLSLVFLSTTTQADDAQPQYGWNTKMVFSLSLTQASFSNWTKGGENSLAWQTKINSQFTNNQEAYNWDNKAKFTFGQSKVGDTGTRKTADEIKLETVFTLKRNLHLNPFVSATALTQFRPGYNFSGTTKTKVSRFLDPGYFTQSAGLGYSKTDAFKARLGATIKETYTRSFPNYADNPRHTRHRKNQNRRWCHRCCRTQPKSQ